MTFSPTYRMERCGRDGVWRYWADFSQGWADKHGVEGSDGAIRWRLVPR